MKKIVILFALLLGNSAFALPNTLGLPEQDALIKTLRAKFSAAKAPTSDALVNQTFNCIERIAIRDNFHQASYKITFADSAGLIQILSCSSCSRVNGTLLIDNGREQIGSLSWPPGLAYLALRKTSEKEMIMELSLTSQFQPESPTLTPLSDAPNAKVGSYSLCTKQ